MSIELKNIRKTFGKVAAVDGVDLTIPDGELVALIGPSGSGKTTLLRIIAGLEVPDNDGAVWFDEKEVSREAVGARGVGFVFQHYALFRHMTVAQNISFGLRVRPWRKRPSKAAIREKVTELLRLIQLEGLENRYPSQLSGGQRQRVALARALAVQPRVLLLDEPFGALDAKVRKSLRQWLRKLHDEIHVTSVFVTHDQEEALEVADRIVVMNQGRIEQMGTPDQVFHQPANPFVMDFLGNVNLFHGRVEDGQAVFGSMVVAAPGGAAHNGSHAKLLVRPHEIELTTQRNGRPTMAARVLRIQSAGSLVKVELAGEQGETFWAEITHEQFAKLGISVSSPIFVSPKNIRVFEQDYSI